MRTLLNETTQPSSELIDRWERNETTDGMEAFLEEIPEKGRFKENQIESDLDEWLEGIIS